MSLDETMVVIQVQSDAKIPVQRSEHCRLYRAAVSKTDRYLERIHDARVPRRMMKGRMICAPEEKRDTNPLAVNDLKKDTENCFVRGGVEIVKQPQEIFIALYK